MAEEATLSTQDQDLLVPSFRTSKRRKVYRKRETSESPPPTTSINNIAIEAPSGAPADNQLSVTDIIRQRKALQRRKGGGIEFSTNKIAPDNIDGGNYEQRNEADTPLHEAEVYTVTSRFAPQTGQVKEVMDKHM